MKVEITSKCGNKYVVNVDKNAQIYPHFKLWELANNKGRTDLPQMLLNADVDNFLSMIEEFRGWWGKPMTCNSCYRQPEYNASIGGAVNSLHLRALAFDWGQTLTYEQRVAVCNQWGAICKRRGKIGGINFYPWGVHFSFDESVFGYNHFIIRNGNTIVNSVPRP